MGDDWKMGDNLEIDFNVKYMSRLENMSRSEKKAYLISKANRNIVTDYNEITKENPVVEFFQHIDSHTCFMLKNGKVGLVINYVAKNGLWEGELTNIDQHTLRFIKSLRMLSESDFLELSKLLKDY
jgi:hypothetical protein